MGRTLAVVVLHQRCAVKGISLPGMVVEADTRLVSAHGYAGNGLCVSRAD